MSGGPWQTFCPPTVSPVCVCVQYICVCVCVHKRVLERDAGGSEHISGDLPVYAKLCQWI